MASNANFISQFVMGGDPCTYKESGELQAEMSKLTHPARPDVDWRQVEKLCLALFRQNGVELQTLVCYVLAITRRQGLAGMADGLGSLDILLQRWADFWPGSFAIPHCVWNGWRLRERKPLSLPLNYPAGK